MECEYQHQFVDDFVVLEEKHFGQYVQRIYDFHALAVSLTEEMKENRIFITGFPFDEGTYLNGGRIGTENGSKSFRDFLLSEKLYVDKEFDEKLKIFDLGDISKVKLPDEDDEEEYQRARQLTLEEAQFSQRQRIGNILDVNLHFKNHAVVFSIGGSNDQSYCNVQSLFDSYPQKRIGVVNIDSQFGVNQLKGKKDVHSGSPFRKMLENPLFLNSSSKFIEFGVKGSQCNQYDYEFLKSKGTDIYWLEKDIRRHQLKIETVNTENNLITQAGQLFEEVLSNLEKVVDVIFVSLDLEAICAKYCPGVSNPSVTGGLSDQEIVEIVKVTANNKKLVLFDISEYNPAVEVKRTGRLIVNIFYQFANQLSKCS